MSVRDYFDRRAGRYSSLPKNSVWNQIKKNEKRALIQLCNGQSSDSILELGAGTGFYTEALSRLPHRRLIAVDFSARMLAPNSFATEKILADIEDLPVGVTKQNYDLILCAGAMEFVKEPGQLLKTLNAVQKTGGIFLGFFPRRGMRTEMYKFFHQRHGIRIHRFSPSEIAQLAAGSGYRMISLKPVFPYNYAVKFLKGV